MSSFGAYGKVNEAEQERLEACRRTRKRIIIITISSIVLVAVVIAAVLGATLSPNGKSNSQNSANSQSISSSIKAICKVTLYPDSCYTSLSSAANSSSGLKPGDLFKLSIQIAMAEVTRASDSLSKNGFRGLITDNTTKIALENCFELLSLSLDHLNDTLYASSNDVTLLQAVDDLKTWLSAAGTYQETCIDGFGSATEGLQTMISENLKNSTEFTSNSLAIVTGISDIVSSFKLRRLMSYETETDDDESPKWLSSKDRKLLQLPKKNIKVDAVVAKDGSGDYKTIKAALKKVPEKSKKRFVIYVKKGVYVENVNVEKTMWNVMMIGDGMNSTVVSGSLNFIDGTPTFATATFATFGKGFIARDMGFVNTAGPAKHQAVALMVSSDQSLFYKCRIDAFQDSLYAHAQRQFFRECTIYGTVDFIFGNAAVIFQKCTILPKVPMLGQQNTITAQGKVDPNQNTGIVIHNCTILPGGDLKSVKTYLGRPWKTYSTTIYIRSMLGSLIDPTGWLPWNATAPTDKIFYSEYQNYGLGSSTKNRVKWKGVKNNLSSKQANEFTVKSFIDGENWISKQDVPYSASL